MTEQAQQYVDDMARSRGHVLDCHKVMAKHDFPVLTGFDAWCEVVDAGGLEPTVTVHEGGSGGSS
ncbi:MAG: hypothetical protein ACRDO0_09935 [Nocardioidaceae bacterium]